MNSQNIVIAFLLLTALTTFFSATMQLIFVYLGAILVLGTPNIDLPKILYVSLLIIMTVSRFRSLFGILSQNYFRDSNLKQNILRITTLLLFLISIQTLVAISNGYSWSEIFRNLFIFVLFILILPISIYCALNLTPSRLITLIVLLGFISSIASAYLWAQRRGLYSFGSSRFGLDAEWIGYIAIIIFLCSRLAESKIEYALRFFMALASTIFLSATLNRTTYVLVFTLLFSSLILSKFRIRILIFKASLSTAYLFAYRIITQNVDSTIVQYRIERSFSYLISGGLSESGLGSDLSILQRAEQAALAFQEWKQNPFLGQGALPISRTLDTSVAALLQFGIIGSAIFLIVLALIMIGLLSNTRAAPELRTVVYIFVILTFISTFIYNWTVNKSYWLSVSLIYSLSVSILHRSALNRNKSDFKS
jgi:hypothetical protein